MGTLLLILLAAVLVVLGLRALIVAGEAWQLTWRLSLTARAMFEQAARNISGKFAGPRPTTPTH
ncbi:MAG TPA: hypothetical protein VH540_22875 [Ktedonobacterales bacterium]|jgi:hypothetical protein